MNVLVDTSLEDAKVILAALNVYSSQVLDDEVVDLVDRYRKIVEQTR